jgi:hypothetical protein
MKRRARSLVPAGDLVKIRLMTPRVVPKNEQVALNLGRDPFETQLGCLARDNQIPPPISALPESRPSSFARDGFMNHALPSPAAIAQAESVAAAMTTEAAHIAASWGPAGSEASMNCGRKAVKKTIVFGWDSATKRPRMK